MNEEKSCITTVSLAGIADERKGGEAYLTGRSSVVRFLKCIEGPWKGGVLEIDTAQEIFRIGSGDSRDISARLTANGISELHCELAYSHEGNSVELINRSETTSTWFRLKANVHQEVSPQTLLRIHDRIFEFVSAEEGLTCDGVGNDMIELSRLDSCNWSVVLKSSDTEAFISVIEKVRIIPGDIFQIGSVMFQAHRINFASASVQGIRPTMEDEDYCTDSLSLNSNILSMFNVYDGHGGSDCSRFLKSSFHDLFVSSFSTDIPSAFFAAFRKADTSFFDLFKMKGLSPNVGAVVNSVVVDDENIFCANLGDCRAIIGMDDGSVVELSRDLKPGLKEEADRIRRLGGSVVSNRVNGRLAVSRAIGDFEYKSNVEGESMVSSVPEIRVHALSGKEQFMVIGCDGLFDVMTSAMVADFVRARKDSQPTHICVDLIAESVTKRGTTDNVTVILVFFPSASMK